MFVSTAKQYLFVVVGRYKLPSNMGHGSNMGAMSVRRRKVTPQEFKSKENTSDSA